MQFNPRFVRIITAFFLLVACSMPMASAQYFRTGEVRCVTNDARLVTLASTYTATNTTDAQLYAERNALENRLFNGIAGCYDQPVITKEADSMQEHPAFYEWLIMKRDYELFITDRKLDTLSKKKKQVKIMETITFDVPALRKEMERQGVIKKLGF